MAKKTPINRAFLATPEGVQWWERECKFSGPAEAHKKLETTLRSYGRWKKEGLPMRYQREFILDRMERLLPRRSYAAR